MTAVHYIMRRIVPILSHVHFGRVCNQPLRPSYRSSIQHLQCTSFQQTVPVTNRSYSTKKAKKEKIVKGGKKKVVCLSDEEIDGIINKEKLDEEMKSVLEELRDHFIHQLTVRTTSGVFDSLIVETPDGKFPLNHIAQIVLKNPHLILINLSSSPQYVAAAKESIQKSGLNVNPQIEGNTIFALLPKVTKEHRENLAKNVKTVAEKSKVKLRDIHGKYLKKIRAAKNNHSEDLIHNLQEMVLDMMHVNIQQIDVLTHTKQKDLLGEK